MPSLPSYVKILAAGYGETRQSALQRSEFEDGPPRQARIRSRVMVRRAATLLIDGPYYLDFLDWYSVDLHEGAAWFDYFDVVRNETVQARFVAADLTAQPTPGLQDWTIPVTIETWG